LIGIWGDYGSADGEFGEASGIATNSSGNVYVADEYTHRIQKFDSEGNFVAKWGEIGVDNGDFYYPDGVATDSSGNVYVADSSNERVQKFDSDGAFITKWDVLDSYGDPDRPSDVAVDSSGNVYVSTYAHVSKFGADNGAAPKVSATTPASGKKGVRRDANLTATFSEQMDSSTLTYWTVKIVKASNRSEVYTDVSCDNPCRTMTIDPESRLASKTKYKATITTNAKDLSGKALTKNYVWTFTTGRK
jgi:DNA-binding beta-propeller fold protein YncE